MIGNRATQGGSAVVLLLVASVAVRVRRSEVVGVVEVTGGTGRGEVRAGQRPAGSAVIKGGGIPGNRIVTRRAVRGRERSAGRGVHGVIGLLPGGQVALRVTAIGRLNIQRVVATNVALRASSDFARRRKLVRIRQREARGAMIELAVGPNGDGMAGGAGRRGRREIRSHVVGDIAANGLRAVPSGSVAGHAIAAAERVVIVDMALGAGCGGMRASQSKSGNAMVECSGVPTFGRVAVGTVDRSKGRAGSGVYGIVGLLPGGQVAL